MSWRSGSKLFIEIWPAIQRNMPDRELRVEFTASLLKLFVRDDMDPYDVECVHPDVRAAMRMAGITITEPEAYTDDDSFSTPAKRRPWWRLW